MYIYLCYISAISLCYLSVYVQSRQGAIWHDRHGQVCIPIYLYIHIYVHIPIYLYRSRARSIYIYILNQAIYLSSISSLDICSPILIVRNTHQSNQPSSIHSLPYLFPIYPYTPIPLYPYTPIPRPIKLDIEGPKKPKRDENTADRGARDGRMSRGGPGRGSGGGGREGRDGRGGREGRESREGSYSRR